MKSASVMMTADKTVDKADYFTLMQQVSYSDCQATGYLIDYFADEGDDAHLMGAPRRGPVRTP